MSDNTLKQSLSKQCRKNRALSCARKGLIVALSSVVLVGCSDDDTKAAGPTYEVEWFKAHEQERKMTLETCSNNPGELEDVPNCKNALEAEQQLSSGALHNVDNW